MEKKKRGKDQSIDCNGHPRRPLGREKTAKILRGVKKCMNRESRFIFFQYTPLLIPFFLKQFEIKKISYVLFNVPPALLFSCVPRGKGSRLLFF